LIDPASGCRLSLLLQGQGSSKLLRGSSLRHEGIRTVLKCEHLVKILAANPTRRLGVGVGAGIRRDASVVSMNYPPA
jgi:hypothetical protein